MATFTPPTYFDSWTRPGQAGHELWRFYDGIPTGYSVLITSGTASTYPGIIGPDEDDISNADSGSGFGGKAAFIGGRTYTITAGEKTILDAAGYTTVA